MYKTIHERPEHRLELRWYCLEDRKGDDEYSIRRTPSHVVLAYPALVYDEQEMKQAMDSSIPGEEYEPDLQTGLLFMRRLSIERLYTFERLGRTCTLVKFTRLLAEDAYTGDTVEIAAPSDPVLELFLLAEAQ